VATSYPKKRRIRMSTVDKDFKVKHGIQVAGNAIVNGTISASDPTLSGHVATKAYVDSLALPVVGASAPESPAAGQLWLDTISLRLHIFDGSSWITLATKSDADFLADHIHDTAIDGTGRITTVFVEAGTPTSTFAQTTDAGSASTIDWEETWSGGIVTDNFN
jgi:hypothetical protein